MEDLAVRGWKAVGPAELSLPLTEPLARWPDEEDLSPLVSLWLFILMRQTKISITTTMYNQVDLNEYVSTRRDALEQISGMPMSAVRAPNDYVLWRADGGWADEVDWRNFCREISARTTLWIDLFRGLVDECLKIRTDRFSTLPEIDLAASGASWESPDVPGALKPS